MNRKGRVMLGVGVSDIVKIYINIPISYFFSLILILMNIPPH